MRKLFQTHRFGLNSSAKCSKRYSGVSFGRSEGSRRTETRRDPSRKARSHGPCRCRSLWRQGQGPYETSGYPFCDPLGICHFSTTASMRSGIIATPTATKSERRLSTSGPIAHPHATAPMNTAKKSSNNAYRRLV